MIRNYGELLTAIQARCSNRADLAPLAPDFATGGLLRINAELIAEGGITDQEQIAYADTVVGVDKYTYPDDFGLLRYIRIGTDPLESSDYGRLIDTYGDNTGLPKQYAILDSSFYLRPIPDDVYRVWIGYITTYPALVANSDTNWLITNAANVWLYAALVDASWYAQDDQAAAKWTQAYKEGVRLVIEADRRSKQGPNQAGLTVDPALLPASSSFNITEG